MCMEKLLLAQDASVLQAMQQLDETGCKILLWAPEGRLAGVLTDGDVRRYILRGGKLDAPALEMVNLRPHALRPAQKDDARRWFKRCPWWTRTAGCWTWYSPAAWTPSPAPRCTRRW